MAAFEPGIEYEVEVEADGLRLKLSGVRLVGAEVAKNFGGPELLFDVQGRLRLWVDDGDKIKAKPKR